MAAGTGTLLSCHMDPQAAIGFQVFVLWFYPKSEESQHEWYLHFTEREPKKAEKQNRELGTKLINWVQDRASEHQALNHMFSKRARVLVST